MGKASRKREGWAREKEIAALDSLFSNQTTSGMNNTNAKFPNTVYSSIFSYKNIYEFRQFNRTD